MDRFVENLSTEERKAAVRDLEAWAWGSLDVSKEAAQDRVDALTLRERERVGVLREAPAFSVSRSLSSSSGRKPKIRNLRDPPGLPRRNSSRHNPPRAFTGPTEKESSR